MVACNASGACRRLRALFARELMLRIVAAFVVGVMLSPLARKLEAFRVPRSVAALLIVCSVAMLIALVIGLIVPRVSELTTGLPALAASLKEKLHVFDGLLGFWHRLTSTAGSGPTSDAVALPLPGVDWVPTTIAFCCRRSRGLYSFSSCSSCSLQNGRSCGGTGHDICEPRFATEVLKILNEIEAGLASYLLTVTLINLSVGAIAGVICALTGMPHAIGFGALAATLTLFRCRTDCDLRCPRFGRRRDRADLRSGAAPRSGFYAAHRRGGAVRDSDDHRAPARTQRTGVLLSLAFWTWLWGPIGAVLSSPILMVALILKERLYVDEEH